MQVELTFKICSCLPMMTIFSTIKFFKSRNRECPSFSLLWDLIAHLFLNICARLCKARKSQNAIPFFVAYRVINLDYRLKKRIRDSLATKCLLPTVHRKTLSICTIITFKVIPQYCIAHPYCARFCVISTRKLARACTDNERISIKLNSIAK